MTKNDNIATLFINMGGPRSLDDVGRFMYNLFNDVHIISAKQPWRSFIARMICWKRVAGVKKNYAEFGNGSPIFKWTEAQGSKTVEKLRSIYPNIQAAFGYSYADPLIGDAIGQLASQAVDEIVVVPLYPYYSIATLGSMYSDIEKARMQYNLGDKIKIVGPYYDHNSYHNGTVKLLQEAIAQIDSTKTYRVIFSAHSLPESFILEKGDPYRQQVQSSYKRILRDVMIADATLAFQSKIGPVAWMRPSTIESVRKAGADGIEQVIVMPLGFTCDHIETLHELDIELADLAKKSGIRKYVRGKVFNDHSDFIDLLADCINEALQ